MGMTSSDRTEMSKLANLKRKTIWTLEEVLDMLAKLDDEGHTELKVYLEASDGGKLIPISFISYDKDEGVIVIG